MIALYELAGAEEDRRFSPYCWRIRMALLHKGLDFETVPWRFTDKQMIAFADSEKVPVLSDGDTHIHDSPAIAAYLERAYPDRPALFDGATAAQSRFIIDWTECVPQSTLFRLLALDIASHLAEKDRDYYRSTREARVGMTLESFCADPQTQLTAFRAGLEPMRRTLKHQPFLNGERAAWPDYVLFGTFQWARCVSPMKLLDESDPVHLWRERMLDLFDGAGRKAKGYPV